MLIMIVGINLSHNGESTYICCPTQRISSEKITRKQEIIENYPLLGLKYWGNVPTLDDIAPNASIDDIFRRCQRRILFKRNGESTRPKHRAMSASNEWLAPSQQCP